MRNGDLHNTIWVHFYDPPRVDRNRNRHASTWIRVDLFEIRRSCLFEAGRPLRAHPPANLRRPAILRDDDTRGAGASLHGPRLHRRVDVGTRRLQRGTTCSLAKTWWSLGVSVSGGPVHPPWRGPQPCSGRVQTGLPASVLPQRAGSEQLYP